MTVNDFHYIWSRKYKHIPSILILNSVFFFKHVPTYLYMMNWTHLLMKISVYLILKFKLCPARNEDTSFFFQWLLPSFSSNRNSKSCMNINIMNLSNNYENLITSTMANVNWLKDKLHFLLYNPRFANRRHNYLSLAEWKLKFHLSFSFWIT